jgi:hypothetical protein
MIDSEYIPFTTMLALRKTILSSKLAILEGRCNTLSPIE